jgi:hypothetical protein
LKTVWIVAGVIGVLVGALWVVQGMNLIPGFVPSFMTGKVSWIGNGALLIAFAVGLLVWANRTPKPPKT